MTVSALPTSAQPFVQHLTETTSIALAQQIQMAAIATDLCPDPIPTAYIHTAYIHGKSTDGVQEPQLQAQDRPPILLLHGFDSSVMEFRRLFPLLAQQRDTWAVDLLGFGLTHRPKTLTFSPLEIRHHLYATWKTLIGTPMVLVGASMGGAAAIDFCLAHPEAVETLVLIDSAGLATAPDMSKLMVPPLGWLAAEFLRDRRVRQRISRTAYFDKTLASPDALACSMLHVTDPGWRRAMIAFTRSGGYTFLSRSMIETLACPTLILWGRNDEILGTADAENFAEAIASSTLVWCDNCGHVPHLEQPEETARQILSTHV